MAEQKNSMPPRRPGGPGHGPRSHGYQRPQDLRGTVKKLLHYVGRYKGLLVLVAICLLLSSVGSVASSYFLKPAINNYILPGDFAGLLKLLVLMGLVFVLSALCSYVYSRIMVRVSQRTVAALRQDLFDKLQGLPLRYFDTHQSGDLMSRFTNDIDTVSEMINNSFANVLSNSLTFLCTIGMLLYLNWALTLITFAFLGLMLLVVKTIGGRSRVSFQRQQAALGDLNGYIEEMIEGQKVIKVFHHEQQAIDQFSARNDTYQTAATTAQTYAGSMMPATANLSRINYAVTCCIGGLLAMGGVFDIGSLGAYLLYVKQVSQPVSQISQQVNTILAAIAGAERIFAVMEAQPEEDEGQTTIVRVEKNGNTLTEVPQRTGHWAWKKPDGSLTELRGDVRFDHVTFGYDPDKVVLHDISLFAEPGQKIAFVGSTGAGKTTITNLINRFYDIQQGTITYDGIDVREIRKNSLRKSLGIVLQDTHLFTGTIADNIRYGQLDATEEQVRAAATLAHTPVQGRFEVVEGLPGRTFIVDYSHNGLALTSALKTLRAYDPHRLLCVFGSVGGRTQVRRKELADASSAYADYTIITSDNPDNEPPEDVIRDIAGHMAPGAPYTCITDRREAIYAAVKMAEPGDIVLFAGKGHEDYQLINGKKLHFVEREIIKEACAEISK